MKKNTLKVALLAGAAAIAMIAAATAVSAQQAAKPPKMHGTEGVGILPLENETVVIGTVKSDNINVTGQVGIDNNTDAVSGSVLVTINPLEPTKVITDKPLPSEEPLTVFQQNMTTVDPLDFGPELQKPDMVVEEPETGPLGIPSVTDKPVEPQQESPLGTPSLTEPEADTSAGPTPDPVNPSIYPIEPPVDPVDTVDSEPVASDPAPVDEAVNEEITGQETVNQTAIFDPVTGDELPDESLFDQPAEGPSDLPYTDEPIDHEPLFEPGYEEPIYDEPLFDEPINYEPIVDEPIFEEFDFGGGGGGGGGYKFDEVVFEELAY